MDKDQCEQCNITESNEDLGRNIDGKDSLEFFIPILSPLFGSIKKPIRFIIDEDDNKEWTYKPETWIASISGINTNAISKEWAIRILRKRNLDYTYTVARAIEGTLFNVHEKISLEEANKYIETWLERKDDEKLLLSWERVRENSKMEAML